VSASRASTIRLGSFRDVNILLIQLKRIGDLILTAPAIAALRKHFPAGEISLVASHGCRELLPAIPGLTRTYVARGKLSDAGDWLSLANSQFDYCFDFSRTDRSAFLTLLSHARNRITYNTVRRSPVRELSYNEFVRSPVRFVHTIDYHLALLTPLGIHAASPNLDLKLPETSRERAAQLLAEQGIDENFVIIHPGSARVEKYWLPKRWAEVIDDCVARRGGNRARGSSESAPPGSDRPGVAVIFRRLPRSGLAARQGRPRAFQGIHRAARDGDRRVARPDSLARHLEVTRRTP
jgi:hypothetical protein